MAPFFRATLRLFSFIAFLFSAIAQRHGVVTRHYSAMTHLVCAGNHNDHQTPSQVEREFSKTADTHFRADQLQRIS